MRGVMDAFSDPLVERVAFMKSAQVGATEFVNNVVGYYIHQDPCPVLVVQPSRDPMAKAWSQDRLKPMIRDTPVLAEIIGPAKSKDGDKSIFYLRFPGGYLAITGANSPAGLASRPVRVVLFDEVDRYPPSAGAEGDPIALGEQRTITFWNSKIVMVSTPTYKGVSRIEQAFEAGDQRYFHVPCPHCGHIQRLRWANVKWLKHEDKKGLDKHRPATALYTCESCGTGWNDAERWGAVKKGEWQAGKPFKGIASFHISALYSPWVKLPDLAREFLAAKGRPEQQQAFTNTKLGETYDAQGETVDETGLLARVEEYGPKVPDKVAVLVAGIDVQDDRVEITVLGFGLGEEVWHIDHFVLRGEPREPALWDEEVDEILNRWWPREDGGRMRIKAACVDTGGHATDQVYAYCKPRFPRKVWAVKGMASGVGGHPRPLWPGKASKNNKGKVRLFLVGVDTGKDLVYARLKTKEPGPGYCHFSLACDLEYFKQLTAETVIIQRQRGHEYRVWHKVYTRNEVLDCWVYAHAALRGLQAGGLRLANELARVQGKADKPSIPMPPPMPGASDPYM